MRSYKDTKLLCPYWKTLCKKDSECKQMDTTSAERQADGKAKNGERIYAFSA